MMDVCYPYFDPDFENLNERINGPCVNVDNDACEYCTVVKVDSLEKQGPLLEVLQVLTDMDLIISKSYISFDAGWFMDVLHVKDKHGNKIRDSRVTNYIQQAIYPRGGLHKPEVQALNLCKDATNSESFHDHTAIEVHGIDRPGIFSDILAVLDEERCSIVEAHAWSHNDCLACVAYVSINDSNRLATIEDHLSTVLQANDNDHGCVKAHFIESDPSVSQTECRLHQLMMANRDFDGSLSRPHCGSRVSVVPMRMIDDEEERRTMVTIDRCTDKGYLIANIECIDRPKLMFDTVCALTDMHYVIFHASITSQDHFACQEYFIRHENGSIEDSAEERRVVSKCLEAAVERRECEGLRLELSAQNSEGLLPYVTRTLLDHGLTVARADIAAHSEQISKVFFVHSVSGNEVGMEIVDSLRKELQPLLFQAKTELKSVRLSSMERAGFSFSNMFRTQLEKFTRSFVSP